MPSWIMKTADDTYRVWSTVVDEWVSEPMDRDQALLMAADRAAASTLMGETEALIAGEDTLRWVDKHLCSCRGRLGESAEIRNGRAIITGGGKVAYHFDSYDEVARFCQTQAEMRADDDE